MKLWLRLALTFSAFTSLAILLAFAVTLAVFKDAQQRSLDEELIDRGLTEVNEVAQLGGQTMRIEQAPSAGANGLGQLVKYAALFSPEGKLIEATVTFGDHAPSLEAVGYHAPMTLPFRSFDFHFGAQILRGVVLRVPSPAQTILLLAAPRDDLDSDVLYLLRVMAIVFAAAAVTSATTGLALGARMARGIEGVARVARRVAEGQMHARVDPLAGDEEVRRLGEDLNSMIARLGSLIDAERRFVSSAAHELRSPLTALRGELELALRHPRALEAYQEAIREALADTNRLISLAEDLLTLARSATNNQMHELAVPALIERAIETSRGGGQVVVDAAPLSVWGRETDLQRMLRNLIDNGVAHAPPGTSVRVRAAVNGESLTLSVEDDGSGVEESVRDRLFEPFARGSRERESSGAGLGLSIAAEIARAHGGEIILDSPANPTRFIARLPRKIKKN